MTPTAWAETDEFYAMFSHEMEERAGAGMGIWNGSTWRTINTKGTDVEFDPYFDGLAHTRGGAQGWTARPLRWTV